MIITEKAKARLLSSACWAKFLSIAACLFAVSFVFKAISIFSLAKELPEEWKVSYAGFACLVISAIYLYPIVKGFLFARKTNTACTTDNENELADAFCEMRSWFVYTGIITIIAIVLDLYIDIKLAELPSTLAAMMAGE
ncbi:MAG: hypothetical protein IJS63_11350 [Bacteroidaceae bacterium]|nr:hypothetical protein [Bacteroidaceae bacterium]